MFIDFWEAKITGFKSIDQLTFDFDQKGINLLKGENGSGKTTIFEALYWCLYGELLKDTKQEGVATKKKYRQDFNGTRVVVTFSNGKDDFIIARHLNYTKNTLGNRGDSKLVVVKNNEQVSEALHKTDIQAYIDEVLGVNAKTFINSVLFGQRMKRLIESDAADKRDIFSQFFDIDWLETAKEKAKEFKDTLKAECTIIERNMAVLSERIKAIHQAEETAKKHKTQWELDKQEQIAELKTEQDSLKVLPNKEPKKKHKDIVLDDSDVRKLQLALTSLENIYAMKQQSINLKVSERQTVDVEISDTCPMCKTKLSPQKVQEAQRTIANKLFILDNEIDKLKKEQSELTITEGKERLSKAKVAYAKQEELYNAESELRRLYNEALKEYEAQKIKNGQITLQKEKITSKIILLKEKVYVPLEDTNEDSIEKVEKALAKGTAELEEKTAEIIKYDWWITKGFGANGLKNYVINSMLQVLNTTIKKYAIRLGLSIKFSIDLEGKTKKFNVDIFKSDGLEIMYNELSGGEKTRIDLALSFGIFDMLAATKTKFNILLLDEAFENLDEAGVYDIGELMREKSQTTNIFFITHGNLDMMGVNEITVRKIDNFTVIG